MLRKIMCFLGFHQYHIMHRTYVDGYVVCYYDCEWCGQTEMDVTETGGYDE